MSNQHYFSLEDEEKLKTHGLDHRSKHYIEVMAKSAATKIGHLKADIFAISTFKADVFRKCLLSTINENTKPDVSRPTSESSADEVVGVQ